MGFVKSLRRSESHNELVDFVEDVNERAALHRKNSARDLASMADVVASPDRKRSHGGDDHHRSKRPAIDDVVQHR